jgi:hypothetical protein
MNTSRPRFPSLCVPVVVALAVLLALVGCSGDGVDAATEGAGARGPGSGSDGSAHAGSGGGAAGSTGVGQTSRTPIILSFAADPPNLPEEGGESTLRWTVQDADTLSLDQGIGAVTGTSKKVQVGATTLFTLTATNAYGSVTATTAVVTGHHPSSDGGRYVAMISPTGGESFVSPATLRLVASAHDPNVDTNSPSPGLGGNAAQVQFFVDNDMVLQVNGDEAEYWIFKGFADGLAAGTHLVWARAIYVDPDLVLDSAPFVVTIDEPPAYAQTVELDADVVLSGNQGYALTGSAGGRIRLNGNGFRVRSAAGASGALTLKFVDVFDLGSRSDTSEPAVDVATTGKVTIEDSAFDTSNTVRVTVDGSAQASIRGNLFRSNMRMPIGQLPDSFNEPASYPVLHFSGSSSADKVFAGNNVGAGWVAFENTQGWLVGGDGDEDSNVLIGPRVGIHVLNSSDVIVRRNYSHHVYYGGWSQGNDFELFDSPDITVEHNVIYGSSWPVRGAGCDFRYNLVLDAGHEWLWPASNASIHHNLFVGGQNDVAGVLVLYDPPDVNIFNNTFDGLNFGGAVTALSMDSGDVSLRSNAFLNFPNSPTVTMSGGTLSADYNLFTLPGVYSDGRNPPHDVRVSDPELTDPPSNVFDLDEPSIWTRNTTAASVLVIYRGRYTPKGQSPLVDAGDPAQGAGNDIGAVGAGQANANDKFGQP